jgi:hypothetical protein
MAFFNSRTTSEFLIIASHIDLWFSRSYRMLEQCRADFYRDEMPSFGDKTPVGPARDFSPFLSIENVIRVGLALNLERTELDDLSAINFNFV